MRCAASPRPPCAPPRLLRARYRRRTPICAAADAAASSPSPWWPLRRRRERTLPNGLRLEYVSAPDVAFLYDEVFVQRCYASHGLPRLGPGDLVVDVGANIGVFSLFAAAALAPGGTLLAAEPVQDTAAVLRRNLARNLGAGGGGVDVRVRCVGLSDAEHADAEIVFYPRAAGWSSLHRDDAEARARVAWRGCC